MPTYTVAHAIRMTTAVSPRKLNPSTERERAARKGTASPAPTGHVYGYSRVRPSPRPTKARASKCSSASSRYARCTG